MSKYLVYNVLTPLGYHAELWTSAGKKNPTYKDLFADEATRIMKIEKTGAKVVKDVPFTPIRPLDATTQSPSVVPDAAAQVKHCQSCGTAMNYREGTSKAGKPYRGFFCPTDKTHEVIWIK